MTTTIDIANRINYLYNKKYGCTIDEMKLHKLLYFAQKESMIRYDEPLFNDSFEAWKFGPVLRSIRNLYKSNFFKDYCDKLDENVEIIISYVIEKYGSISSWALSNITHKEFCWINARGNIPEFENCNNEISINDMKIDVMFEKMLRQTQEE